MTGQLMSPWPVHGSVLVEGDLVLAMAGWYSIESEQVYMYGLSLADGKVVWERPVEGLKSVGNGWQGTRTPWVKRNEVLGLVDGQVFGLDPATGKTLDPSGRWHFLDLSPFPVNPVARVVATRQSSLWKNRRVDLCGDGRDPIHGVLCTFIGQVRNETLPSGNLPRLPKVAKSLNSKGATWMAMMVAGDEALVAGGEGKGDKQGFFLRAYSTDDLSLIEEIPLPAKPAFRGLIAAGGRLYVSCEDDSVVCLAPKP
jgi:hypothetical protein